MLFNDGDHSVPIVIQRNAIFTKYIKYVTNIRRGMDSRRMAQNNAPHPLTAMVIVYTIPQNVQHYNIVIT